MKTERDRISCCVERTTVDGIPKELGEVLLGCLFSEASDEFSLLRRLLVRELGRDSSRTWRKAP